MSDRQPYQFFEDLPADQFAALVEDIRANGVRVPIEFDENGATLDGHQRLRAVKLLADEGVKVDYASQVRPFTSEAEKRIHARTLNLRRRHLTREQMKEHAAAMRKDGATLEAVAAAVNVDPETVRRWTHDESTSANAKVEGKDGKKRPATYKPRKSTTVQCKTAKETARAVAAVAKIPDDKQPATTIDVKRAERLARESEPKTPPTPEPEITGTEIICRAGDFRTVLAAIPPASVDLIFTDPPYPKEFLPLWADMAAFAAEKLKPGGCLAAYSGQSHLPDVIQSLTNHLDYIWTIAVRGRGPKTQIFQPRIWSAWKPIFLFAKPPVLRTEWLDDLFEGTGPEKDAHGWQQGLGEAEHFIRLLSEPGDIVVDPFLGGGTTAVACRNTGRRFIGAEIDAAAYGQTMERLKNGKA